MNIANEAKMLQREIWEKRDLLWPGKEVVPLDVLTPEAAAEVLGLEYLEFPDLGSDRFGFRGKNFRVAGLIDRQARKIAVSQAFHPKVMKFTGAHEIGHWLLHPGEIMHRDRPLDGAESSNSARPEIEKQADYFAACFLMPARLLAQIFKERFLTEIPFDMSETAAFHLNPSDPDSLVWADQDSLEREFAMARSTSYNGTYFRSLSDTFGVSDSAMAIRLRELKLIRWP